MQLNCYNVSYKFNFIEATVIQWLLLMSDALWKLSLIKNEHFVWNLFSFSQCITIQIDIELAGKVLGQMTAF